MKKRLIFTLIAVAAISLGTALVLSAPWDTITPAVADTLKSDLPRIESPDTDTSEQALLIEGNSAFAFELYQALLKDKEANFFCSPHSISVALAMTYAGARGETAEQIADTLHFLLEPEELQLAFNWLDAELAKRGEGAKGDDEGFRLNIVNAIWRQKDYEFLTEFLDVLAENYGAGLRILDFITETEESRLAINQWVSDYTEGRIKDLIPRGAVDALTRLVLTNAIYFNADWEHPFDARSTENGRFYLLDGRHVTVPMMKQIEEFGYARGQGYQVVEMLYDGAEFSMVILLPDEGQFEPFKEELQAERVCGIINGLQCVQMALTMPKFEFDSEFNLNTTLAGLGMPDAFIPPCPFSAEGADFSGMTGKRELFVTDVVHKAFVAVDEAGTEAAAATGVIIAPTAMHPDPDVEVTIDRPFIFLMRDIETGAILFVGRVLNPGA